jgi:hypothetical protein
MGFLLKAAFWLAVVIVLLPAPEDRQVVSQDGTPVDGTEAIGVARDLVADMSGFCTRNPEACDTGIAAAQAFGVKAQHGAKMLYDYLEQFNAEGGDSIDLSAHRPANSNVPAHGASQIGGRAPQWTDGIGHLTQQNAAAAPQDPAMQVQNVQSIRIPVQGYGQATIAAAPENIAANTTATAQPADHRGSVWEANPVAGLGNSAWRQPLTRSELAQAPQASSAHDAIGVLIQQSQ